MSFCGLTNIFNILVKQQNDTDVNYNIEYTTKHFFACFTIDIKRTEIKPGYVLTCRQCIRSHSILNGNGNGCTI